MSVTMRKSPGELQAICITQLQVESLILSACFCNLSFYTFPVYEKVLLLAGTRQETMAILPGSVQRVPGHSQRCCGSNALC